MTDIQARIDRVMELDKIKILMQDAKRIPEFEGYYITSCANVISTQRWRNGSARLLTVSEDNCGYKRVTMNHSSGKKKHKCVHRLVAEAFLPSKSSPEHQIRHIDGNKLNNHISNLAWGTAQDNANDRELHGTTARGSKIGNSRFKEKDVGIVKSLLNNGCEVPSIANFYKVAPELISNIKLEKTWEHIVANDKDALSIFSTILGRLELTEQTIAATPEMVSIIKELQAQLSAKEITINETWEALLASRALREKMKQELSAKDEELTNMIERHDYEVDECVQDMHQLKQKLVAKDALIAELQKENEWLPIADAPRDNTPVIVWHEHKTGYKAMYIAKYDHGSSISRVYSEIYGNVYNIQPTHFLKLPEPPKGI